jgi:hypothetical protein
MTPGPPSRTAFRPSPSAVPAPGEPVTVLIPEARHHRRMRRRRGGLFMAVAVVAAVGIVVGVTQTAGRRHATTRARPLPAVSAVSATMSDTIVAQSSQNRGLVVLSARTGRVLRTLARNVSVDEPGSPGFSVSPGGTVYFDSAGAAPYNDGRWGGGDQIFAVPIGGGEVRHVQPGTDPTISPDGRLLASLIPTTDRQLSHTVVIASVDHNHLTPVKTIDVRGSSPDITQLSWSADSRDLSFAVLGASSVSFWMVDTSAPVPSSWYARRIPLHGRALSWSGFWRRSPSGRVQGVGILTDAQGRQSLVVIDPDSGVVVSTLTAVPGDVCVPIAVRGCADAGPDQVSSDAAAGVVLFSARSSSVPGGVPILYRWALTDPRTTAVAPRVSAALPG